VDEEKHTITWGECIACGQCVEHCPHSALAIKGYGISADKVVDKAARLKPFFEHSNGGITLTGGEVTRQANFATAILAGCQDRGIHTAIETSGACAWTQLEQLVVYTDMVLYDVKLIDEEEHRRWTGTSNRQILRNAARLANHNVQIRVPLIPNITDTEDNLRGIFDFMRSVGLLSVGLLPYNTSSSAKYEWLGLSCEEIQGETQSREHLDSLVDMARQMGIEAIIC